MKPLTKDTPIYLPGWDVPFLVRAGCNVEIRAGKTDFVRTEKWVHIEGANETVIFERVMWL